MHPFIMGKIINGLIWITCGAVVIAFRGPLSFQNSYFLVWDIIGGAMIAFGTVRLVWAVFRGVPEQAQISRSP
ncbi:MAG TPA: hypothetical protein VFV92_15185 [Candidatus Bathyarchaeia archaeon]|nr:hypothetical protein [Candidatus Bathyarchaeia archaeon]